MRLPYSSVAGLVLLLAACPSPEEAREATIEPPPGSPPGAPTVTPTPAVERFAVRPIGRSGVTGEAVIREVGARSSVQLTLRAAPADTTVPAAIHQGTCPEEGPPVYALEPVITDAEGLGTSVATLDEPIRSLTDGRHSVHVGDRTAPAGQPLACGEIPAAP